MSQWIPATNRLEPGNGSDQVENVAYAGPVQSTSPQIPWMQPPAPARYPQFRADLTSESTGASAVGVSNRHTGPSERSPEVRFSIVTAQKFGPRPGHRVLGM